MYFILLITVLITAVFLVVAAFVIAKLMGPRTYKRESRSSVVFLHTVLHGYLYTWAIIFSQSFSSCSTWRRCSSIRGLS